MKASNVLAFLGGIAAGVLVGIMFAPDKGSETRKKIIEILEEKGLTLSCEQIESFIEDVKSKLRKGFRDEDISLAVEEVLSGEEI